MKIEVWSDFVCPFCYIGKRHLEKALASVPFAQHVEVEFKSFELDPNAPKYEGKSIHEVLAKKYGMSLEQAMQANERVGQQAASVGLTFHFDEMKPTNTFDAHRLMKYAKTQGKEKEITEKILYEYFTESRHIGDVETLAKIAVETGLSRDEAIKVLLDSTDFENEVRLDESLAQQYGITSVPFFVLNGKYAISGAQPIETFLNAIKKVWEEESVPPFLQDLSGPNASETSCTDGNCAIPEKED